MTEKKIIYPELSYQIVGCAFKVFNKIGFGMGEKFYQQAFASELKLAGISYDREKIIKVVYQPDLTKRYLLDFVIDDKIIVELKIRPRLGYVHIKQVTEYLKAGGYILAILIYYTKDGVKYRRVINQTI